MGLALAATLVAIWSKISTALSEIVVGIVAQLIIGAIVGPQALGSSSAWVTFLAGTGAIVLTFHGHSVIFERVLGSTARSIVRHAPCSVLLAK